MKSFLPWILGGYLVWLFATKDPQGNPWANTMGRYLIKRDVCKTTASSSGTMQTPSVPTATTISNTATQDMLGIP